jgi:hypothetical protein
MEGAGVSPYSKTPLQLMAFISRILLDAIA